MNYIILSVVILGTVNSIFGLEAKCKDVDIKLTEEQMMPIKECAATLKITAVTDLNPSNAGCFSKCILEKKGLMDNAGKPHKENIMKVIDDNLPASLKDAWKAAIEKCLDNEGSQVKSPDNEKCSSYMPLSMCVHNAFLNICK